MPEVTLKDLLEAGVHFGHQKNYWNPKMAPYIYGVRNRIHIIDLQVTMKKLHRAMDFLSNVTARGEKVLFVGTKPQAQLVVEEEATRAGQPFIVNRWLGGSLTNFSTIKKSLDKIKEIESLLDVGSVEKLPKKEVLYLEKRLNKMLKNLRGIRDMRDFPGALFVIDVRKEHNAVREANRVGIPVVALVDTNCDPDDIDYVIPGNDDATRAVKLIVRLAADACSEGIEMANSRKPGGEFEGEWGGPKTPETGPEVIVRGGGQTIQTE